MKLSALEKKVVHITNLSATITGIENTISFGTSACNEQNLSSAPNDVVSSEILNSVQQSDSDTNDLRCSGPAPKRNKPSTYTLLEQQVHEQREFHKSLKEAIKISNEYMATISRTLTRIDETKKIQLQEQMRHNREMERISLEKLRVKQKILELELTHLKQNLK